MGGGMVTSAVHVDAAFHRDIQRAAVAVCLPDGRMLAGEVISCRDVVEAEILAAVLACAVLASRQAEAGSVILTDSNSAVMHVAKSPRTKYERAPELRSMLADHGWKMRWVPRRKVNHADAAARKLLKAWRFGSEGRTTWQPNVYVKQGMANR